LAALVFFSVEARKNIKVKGSVSWKYFVYVQNVVTNRQSQGAFLYNSKAYQLDHHFIGLVT
jgi:hypothetical protein